jgi:hypothetical protein
MTELPCLLHGKYTSGKRRSGKQDGPPHNPQGYGLEPGQDLCIVDANVWGSNHRIGAMMHRRVDGSILRPHYTRGHYWLHELEKAKAAGLIDRYVCHSWHIYEPCDCPRPLADVERLYQERVKLGPDGCCRDLCWNLFGAVSVGRGYWVRRRGQLAHW